MFKDKDYLLGYEVIISPERAKRPSQFKEESKDDSKKECPFCPGNEDKTPLEHWRINNERGEWIIRCFPNKYKIWKFHDLIVDTRDHNKDWFEIDYLDLVFKTMQRRIKELYMEKEVVYVQLFRNYGKNSGASIKHSHFQIVGLTFLPEKIQELSGKINNCYCKICKEKWKSQKVLFEGNFFRVLTLNSRFPYEIEVHIKEHKDFLELNKEELKELTFIVKKIVKRIRKFFDSYNVLFFISPKGKNNHFFMRIFPRGLNTWGGLELSSNVFVNSIDKEKSFEFYKNIF